jgi:UDP-N-acetylglucosamine 3-dehydrogenase
MNGSKTGIKTRIGLLGAGAMATAHAAAYADMSDVEVVGVFGRDAGRAGRVAAICSATAFATADAVIGNAAIDAVDVCLPSSIHHDFVVAALSHGKHVFCETPLALTTNEARAMRDAARRAGRLLQVGLLMRSVPSYAHVKAVALSGDYGSLINLSAYRLGSYLRPGASDHKPHYGDPTTELMTFDFDFANWLMGLPVRVAASAGSSRGDVCAVLSYREDCHATVTASGLMPASFPFTVGFRVLFERALFELHNVFETAGPPRSRFTICDDVGGLRAVALRGQNPYRAELARFVDCIAGRADPALLDVERAIEALTLSIATQRSLAESRAIELQRDE